MLKKIIEKIYLKQKNNLAFYDIFFNCYNRNYYEYIKTKFNNKKIEIAMIDIDDLKTINDSYGHIYGDEFIANIVKDLKKFGKVIRVGGDEFLIILSKKENFLNYCLSNNKFSYGLAIKQHNMSLQTAVSNADELMYIDKLNKKKLKAETENSKIKIIKIFHKDVQFTKLEEL